MAGYENLVVIGNGFDVAHDLNTRYSDFMSDIWKRDRGFYDQLIKYIFEDDLWNDFENALGFFDEGEIREMSEANYLNYHEWRNESQQAIVEELKFSTRISEFLSEWIQSIDTKVSAIVSGKVVNNQNIYINFNYTDTLESVYGILENNICYIHGKAIRNDKLIIGHRNEFAYAGKNPLMLTYEEMNEWIEFQMNRTYEEAEKEVQIYKYFANTYKDTDAIIGTHKEVFSKINSVKKIYVLGHSLSHVDFPYFKKIYDCVSPECMWCITYYSEKDKKNAYNFVEKLGVKKYLIDTFDNLCK